MNAGIHGASPKPTTTGEKLAGAGITVVDLTSAARQKFGIDEFVVGALITDVRAGSHAATLGLRPGDAITGVALKPVHSAREAAATFAKLRVEGRSIVALLVSRMDGDRFVALRLMTQHDEDQRNGERGHRDYQEIDRIETSHKVVLN